MDLTRKTEAIDKCATHQPRPTFHDVRPTTHDPRPTTHDPRPTTHIPKRFSHPLRSEDGDADADEKAN